MYVSLNSSVSAANNYYRTNVNNKSMPQTTESLKFGALAVGVKSKTATMGLFDYFAACYRGIQKKIAQNRENKIIAIAGQSTSELKNEAKQLELEALSLLHSNGKTKKKIINNIKGVFDEFALPFDVQHCDEFNPIFEKIAGTDNKRTLILNSKKHPGVSLAIRKGELDFEGAGYPIINYSDANKTKARAIALWPSNKLEFYDGFELNGHKFIQRSNTLEVEDNKTRGVFSNTKFVFNTEDKTIKKIVQNGNVSGGENEKVTRKISFIDGKASELTHTTHSSEQESIYIYL